MGFKEKIVKLLPGLASRRGIRMGLYDSCVAPTSISDYGVSVDNNSAFQITALYAGIRLIAENIASLPIDLKRRGEPYESPLRSVLTRNPNPYTNAFSFWSSIVTWLNGWGNAYAVVEHLDGSPRLHQIHPANVQVRIVDGRKWYKVYGMGPDLDFLNRVYSNDEMLHFMLLSMDGIVGVNPIIYNASALGKFVATEKFGAQFYTKGGNVRAVMEMDGSMGDEAYEAFMKHYSNSASNFDTPLLEYGVKYKQLSINPVAAQLIQSETMSIQDVCRILNIPPHMLAELSHATFSNIEHQTIQFVQYTLRPIIKRIELELESKLFHDPDVDVEFVINGLLRGDTASRSAYYHNAILDGYMSRNEVRTLEGLNPVQGLDTMLYPLNSGTVDGAGNIHDNDNNEEDE